jgi:GT2 family glycosyltransferase
VSVDPARPQAGHVDALAAIDGRSFYAAGWIRDAEAKVTRMTAVTPEGERIELLPRLFRYPRPELDSLYANGPYANAGQAEGFLAYFETKRPSNLRTGWVFEVANEADSAFEMSARCLQELDASREAVLRSVPNSLLPNEELMSKHLFPALNGLQERVKEFVKRRSVSDYGSPPDSAEVSIIVPLYRRTDLVEHQLVQFVHDPEIRSAELIYVLDSPELGKVLEQRAHQLFELYRVPFRVVTMERNVGFGGANNAAASVARGRLLLLLNSDVLPDKPGWLGEMQRFYDSVGQIGALGPKLLYEDDSLQHAGMYYEVVNEGPSSGQWALFHYFKGMHRDLPAANIARPVPAVTAACLMVARELFERAGGLPHSSVHGDYEDSDLCLRLLEAGRENLYLPEVELYHLEAQSYGGVDRGSALPYNRWLHNRRWRESIEAVAARYPSDA